MIKFLLSTTFSFIGLATLASSERTPQPKVECAIELACETQEGTGVLPPQEGERKRTLLYGLSTREKQQLQKKVRYARINEDGSIRPLDNKTHIRPT